LRTAMTHHVKRTRGPARQRLQPAAKRPVFHLYISGATPRSSIAITNLKPVLEKLFDGDYELRVTDIYQEPHKANAVQVYVTPTLVREHPEPVVRMVGDFSSEDVIRSLLIEQLTNEKPDE
ncbi:MAG: circadian clock KaiB family protein, partial [Limisphaerales bacterium]